MNDTLRRLAYRIAAFVRRDPLDRDLDTELASHLAMAEDEHKLTAGYPHFLGLCCRAALFNEGM